MGSKKKLSLDAVGSAMKSRTAEDFADETIGAVVTRDAKEKKAKAREYKHMTFYEAAHLAKEAGVKQLWLTHYSPSLTRPEEFMKDVRKIFPESYAGKDGKSVDLLFDEE